MWDDIFKSAQDLFAGRRFIAVLFLLAWLPRLGLAVSLAPRNPHPYDPLYEQMASNYAAGRGLVAYERFGPHPPMALRSFRPPLFPWVWGLLYRPTGGAYRPVRVFHSLLGACVPVIVFLMASALFGKKCGVLAGLGCAFYPPLIWHSVHLMTEPLFIFFHTLTFYFLLTLDSGPTPDIGASIEAGAKSGDEKRRYSTNLLRGILSGAAAGLAVLSRSVMLGFVPIAALWMLLRAHPWRKNMAQCALFVTSFALVMLPWWIRNYSVHGCFVASTTDGGHGFYGGNNEVALRRATGFGWPADWAVLAGVQTEVQMDRTLYAAGLRFWKQNPSAVPRLMFDRFCRLWRPWPHVRFTEIWNEGSDDALPPLTPRSIFIAIVYFLSFLATFPVMAIGFVASWKEDRSKRAQWVLVLLLVLYTTAIHMVFQATIRYREPMWPVLFVFWAAALVKWNDNKRKNLAAQTKKETRGN